MPKFKIMAIKEFTIDCYYDGDTVEDAIDKFHRNFKISDMEEGKLEVYEAYEASAEELHEEFGIKV
jgi:hypothetical protein